MACVGKPFSLKQIENFYQKYSRNNPHAAGYALVHNNSVLYNKKPGIGTNLFNQDKNQIAKVLPTTKLGLFHVRFATHGTSEDNRNNHPIFHSLNGKIKSMIIHNGIVTVDKNLPTDGQTDTEQILSYWDKEGPECLAKFSGSAAIVVVDCGKVYAYHHGAPLYYEQKDYGMYLHQSSEFHNKVVPKNVVFEVSSSGLTPVCSVEMRSSYRINYVCNSPRSTIMARPTNADRDVFWNSYEENDENANDVDLSLKSFYDKYGIKPSNYYEEDE